MNRRSFLKQGCAVCLGAVAFSTIIESCKSIRYASGTLQKDGVDLSLDEFRLKDGSFRSYVIVRHAELQYPICVYRFSDREYTALWMQCTHQGAELQASGDRLTCPAHGSEFDNRGLVRQGPAANGLRTFPVTIQGDQLFIDLRKQA